jgi:hypothetical protein
MALAVSRRPHTEEARVPARVGICRICSGQSGTGICLPYQHHSTVALLTGGLTISLSVAAVQRKSHPIGKRTTIS